MDTTLYHRSIHIIMQNQAESGAYIASPNFPSYAYCWLRDGSFIAHSMVQAGEIESARRFYRWVARTIQQHEEKVAYIINAVKKRLPLKDSDFLHTRYTLYGQETYDDTTWGNFQYDGYGTWLWALSEHVRLSGDVSILPEVSEAIALTTRYLLSVWTLPGYDCWEEHPEYLHPYSLSAAYAGLRAASEMTRQGYLELDKTLLDETIEKISGYVRKYGVREGRLVKSIRPGEGGLEPEGCLDFGVDASLLACALPYRLFDGKEPIFLQTLARIEADLHRDGGGVYRYRADTYYGGGEWILLAAWLGWYHAETGSLEKARAIARWIESQAAPDGSLPEQVNTNLLDPSYLRFWQEKWGPVASPLLWSHAMYIILIQAIQRAL